MIHVLRMHDFSRFAKEKVMHMRPRPGRVQTILATITAILAAGTLAHGAAASLRGKLQFLLCTAGAGMRIARSALAALASVRKGGPLSHPVRATLTFLQFLLPILPSRLVNLRERARGSQSRPAIVWSGAACEESSATGGLGFVVWFPPGHPGASPSKGRFRYAARKGVRADDFPFFSRSHHLIQQLELLAAAAVYTSSLPNSLRVSRSCISLTMSGPCLA